MNDKDIHDAAGAAGNSETPTAANDGQTNDPLRMREFDSGQNDFMHEQALDEDEGYVPPVTRAVMNDGVVGSGAVGVGGAWAQGDDAAKEASFGEAQGVQDADATKDMEDDAESDAEDGKLPADFEQKGASGQPGGGRPASAEYVRRPRLDAPDLGPPTIISKIFSFFSIVPIFWLVVILAGLTVWGLGQRELWFSDEVRHANAFQNLLYHGKWLVLELNGQVYPDKPPLYFWFLRGLFELVKVEGPFLYLLAAAVSGLLYLLSFLALGKFVARFDRRTLFASGLVLLLCGYVYGTLHYARMDLLFAALIVGSQVMLYLALIRKRSLAFMGLAFLLAGLAVLVKGPLGVILPVVTGLVFIVWCGNFRRLFRLDVLFGLIIFAIVIGLWAGAIIRQTGGTDYLFNEIIGKQVAARAFDAFHHKQPWHYYFSRLPLAFLPFSLVFFCLPWNRFLGKGMRRAIAESRTPEKDGLGFVWIMFLTGFAVLSLTSTKIVIYFMPIFPALALITGRAILSLTGARATAFRYIVALFLFVAAVALVIATFMLNGLLPFPEIKGIPGWPPLEITGALLVAAIILLCACWLAFALSKSRPEGVLLSLAVAWLLFSWPMGKLVAPAFDGVLSPRGQALVLKEYADAGYYPVSYREYEGTYTYYAQHNTNELKSLDDTHTLTAEGKKYILALRAKEWDKWENRPDCLNMVDRRWIAEREYVLAACPSVLEKDKQPGAEQPSTQPEDGQGGDSDTGDTAATQTSPDTPDKSSSDSLDPPDTSGQSDSDQPIANDDNTTSTPESVPELPRNAPEPTKPYTPTPEGASTPDNVAPAPDPNAAPGASDGNEASAAPPTQPILPEQNTTPSVPLPGNLPE